MSENRNEIELKDLLINFKDYVNYLFTKKYYIISFTLLFIILGAAYNINSDDVYKAELKFVVDDKGGSGDLSSMSSIANDFGINIGGGNSSIFNQNNIIELLKSRGIIVSTLMQKVKINRKRNFLIEHYIKINNLNEDLDNNSISNKISFHDRRSLLHDSISGVIWKEIIKDNLIVEIENNNASIITLTYLSKNQEFAKKFVVKLINEMSKMYIVHETAQANNTLNFLQDRADSVFTELVRKEKEFAKVKDINQRIIKASGRLKEFQLQRSVEVLNTMYLELTKNLELSKLTLLNQTPNINILDKPILPLESNKLSLVFVSILCGLLAFIIIVFYFLLSKLFNDSIDS